MGLGCRVLFESPKKSRSRLPRTPRDRAARSAWVCRFANADNFIRLEDGSCTCACRTCWRRAAPIEALAHISWQLYCKETPRIYALATGSTNRAMWRRTGRQIRGRNSSRTAGTPQSARVFGAAECPSMCWVGPSSAGVVAPRGPCWDISTRRITPSSSAGFSTARKFSR